MSSQSGLTILGCNSSIPGIDRMCTCQILQAGGNLYMIDCGEGSQLQLSRFGISRNKIKAIFISHFHGDHLYGLPGLLTSYMHFSRRDDLQIIGPKGLKDYLDSVFRVSEAHFDFKIVVTETMTEHSELVYEDSQIRVHNFELKHRIPTQGFVFEGQVKERNIIRENIQAYRLSMEEIIQLKNHQTIHRGDISISPDDVCHPEKKIGKYVFMSDTSYMAEIPAIIYDADILYHEATYLQDMVEKAAQRGHSTAMEAAKTAMKSRAGQLILGHYSNRYADLNPFLTEAGRIFENSHLAEDGKFFPLSL